MRFEQYILGPHNITHKDRCPTECQFKANTTTPIVGIPLPQWPQKTLGVLISRDPTTAFIEPYMAARNGLIDNWRRSLMAVDAPPQWLIRHIEIYDQRYLDGRHAHEMDKLSRAIAENVYWTHLHKCCTDKKGKEAPAYSYTNAEQCAGEWLSKELSDAIRLKMQFVLCLGADVERFVSGWAEGGPGKDRIKVLYLPHPAGTAIGAWNPKDPAKREKMAYAIDELFRIINSSDSSAI